VHVHIRVELILLQGRIQQRTQLGAKLLEGIRRIPPLGQ
jgi:hypothetical protein